ncbi:MAG: type III pantothenate kinase [Akkermansia muciniphila]
MSCPPLESTLLIDNSNTRTKFLLMQEGQLLHGSMRSIPTVEITPASVSALLAGWSFRRAVIASVVPCALEVLLASLPCPVTVLSAASSPLPLDFDYPGVGTLGADRVANALAVAVEYALPCIAIDLGTAVTFDVIVERNSRACFIGGVISPGLLTLAGSLHRNTAQLPQIALSRPPHAIGRNTREAMQIGVHLGFVGMVSAIVSGLRRELGTEAGLVLTGGDAELIAPHLSGKVTIAPYLTFNGIALAAQALT